MTDERLLKLAGWERKGENLWRHAQAHDPNWGFEARVALVHPITTVALHEWANSEGRQTDHSAYEYEGWSVSVMNLRDAPFESLEGLGPTYNEALRAAVEVYQVAVGEWS